MNFNASTGLRPPVQGPGRKVKRVSDVNAMGPPVSTPQYAPQPTSYETTQNPPQFGDPNAVGGMNNMQQEQHFGYIPPQQPVNMAPNPYMNYPNTAAPTAPLNFQQPQGIPNQNFQQPQAIPNQFTNVLPQQFSVLQQPVVQDMAMQYGQKLADQGKQLVESHFEKWVPVTRLKYYFAVDNKYVINKIRLLFFPFTHTDWSLKYDQESPVQPRYDINAPDLYIPTMAYITYVVLAGLMLGIQDRFSPEQLSIIASSSLAYTLFELFIYSITLYVANIPTNLKTLDLVAFAGYKFIVINACLLMSIFFYSSGYYISLIYCSLSLGFFLLRTLKTKVLQDSQPVAPSTGISYNPYSGPQETHQFDYSVGRKRKLYFLFLIVGLQAFLSFWLSKHLILNGKTLTTNSS